MILIIVSFITLLGHLTMALPMESPASNLTQYFDSRIVGGTVAPRGSSPWMVALIVGGYFTSFVCGGSIISPIHVMTAAHCITSFVDWHGNLLITFHGKVGTLTWNQGGIPVRFSAYKNHPDYNQVTMKNDLGLLILETELPISAKVQPIILHKGTVDGGAPCYATGWGTERLWGNVPEHLRILYMHTISERQCQKLISSVSGPWPPPPVDHKLEICTFHSPGHGMCHGDSGSALVLIKDGRLIGIVSWGFPCAIGGPDMFVRIEPYFGFIEEFVRKRGYNI